MVYFVLKILRKQTTISSERYWSFFLAITSKYAPEDFKKIKKKILRKNFIKFRSKKKLGKKSSNIFCVRGAPPPEITGSWGVGGFAPHTPHRRLRPQALDAFGLNPHSQLVAGFHWLAFLNQVRKNLSNFFKNFSTKSIICQKVKIEKNVFYIGFRKLRIFLYQKPNLATFKGVVGVSAGH